MLSPPVINSSKGQTIARIAVWCSVAQEDVHTGSAAHQSLWIPLGDSGTEMHIANVII